MFRNYLAAALNNLSRNRLYAAISIVGLAIGMAAAILTALYIRDELGFDRFIPGYRNVYVVVSQFNTPGRPPLVADFAPAQTGEWMRLDFPEAKAASRLVNQDLGVRHGDVEALEHLGWVDPDFFTILPLPLVAGDPVAAMHRPDGVVLTRAMARKYFGQDAPIGQVLEVSHRIQFRVGAVIEDLPANTHLKPAIYVSGLSSSAPMRAFEARPMPRGGFNVVGRTYVMLPNAAAAARINAAMPAFFARHIALPNGKMLGDFSASMKLVPLSALHLYPLGGTVMVDSTAQGSPTTLVALGLIAVLILAVAGINFVNLMTARAGRRAVEVGVRKAVGAEQRDLVLQFIGEAVIYALIGLVLALSLVELVLPGMRALLDRPLDFAFWREPALLFAALAMSLLVGGLAGVYPAFVQASFRPALVLKGGMPRTAGSEIVRAGLATLQFAALIGLILGVWVIGRQTRFALNEGLRVDKDHMLTVNLYNPPLTVPPPGTPPKPLCRDAFPDAVRALPGVKGAACSATTALDQGDSETAFVLPNGGTVGVGQATVDYGFFELYGLKPVAGRFFSRDHPGDETPLDRPPFYPPKVVIVNEKAARALGYADPAQAVDKAVRVQMGGPGGVTVPIIGVVPDFAFDMVHGLQRPMVYTLVTPALSTMSVKLDGARIPETLKAIDALWRRTGSARPTDRRFVDDYLQTVYVGAVREGYLIDTLCGVAVFIAALGLFGLAAFTAERRTKEIGIRKAMGADRGDIVRLLLWSFTKPVLWANLIAWPLGWWALDRWLHGFGRHIDLDPWTFLAASLAALVIAWITVLAHTLKVAGAKPVTALRYE